MSRTINDRLMCKPFVFWIFVMFAKRYIKLGGMWSKAIDVIGFPLMFKQQRDGCVFKLGVNVISLSEQSRVSIFVMCEVFILVNLFLCKQSVLRFGYLSIPSRLEMSALGRANSFKRESIGKSPRLSFSNS